MVTTKQITRREAELTAIQEEIKKFQNANDESKKIALVVIDKSTQVFNCNFNTLEELVWALATAQTATMNSIIDYK